MTIFLLLIIIVLLSLDIHDHRSCCRTGMTIPPDQAAERRIHRLIDEATLDMLDEVRRAWRVDDTGDAA